MAAFVLVPEYPENVSPERVQFAAVPPISMAWPVPPEVKEERDMFAAFAGLVTVTFVFTNVLFVMTAAFVTNEEQSCQEMLSQV